MLLFSGKASSLSALKRAAGTFCETSPFVPHNRKCVMWVQNDGRTIPSSKSAEVFDVSFSLFLSFHLFLYLSQIGFVMAVKVLLNRLLVSVCCELKYRHVQSNICSSFKDNQRSEHKEFHNSWKTALINNEKKKKISTRKSPLLDAIIFTLYIIFIFIIIFYLNMHTFWITTTI